MAQQDTPENPDYVPDFYFEGGSILHHNTPTPGEWIKVFENDRKGFQRCSEAAAWSIKGLPSHAPFVGDRNNVIAQLAKGLEAGGVITWDHEGVWYEYRGVVIKKWCGFDNLPFCTAPPPCEYRPDIELTSETAATLPANRDRTTIGVGESVTIRSNVDVEWEGFNTDIGSFTLIDSKTASITAKDKAGAITVKAKNDCDTESITFNVITPERLDYEQSYTSDTHETMQIHEQGTALFRSILKVTVYPTTVNFSAIRIREVDVATTTSTGYFNDGKNKCHIAQGDNVPCTGAGNNYGVEDIDGRNNYVKNLDTIGIYTNALIDLNSIPPLSTATFDIPIEWTFNPQIASTPWRQMPRKSRQETILKNNGDITNKKGSFSATINVQDPTSGGQFIQ